MTIHPRTTQPTPQRRGRPAAQPDRPGPAAGIPDHRRSTVSLQSLDLAIQASPSLAAQRSKARSMGHGRAPVQRALTPSGGADDWAGLTTGSTGAGVTGVIVAGNAAGEQIVVKGLDEPPQRAMLAQELMNRVGVATAETRPVMVASPLGQHILDQLDALAQTLTAHGDAQGAAIAQKVQAWRGVTALLLMEKADVKNLQELVVNGPDVPVLAGAAQEQYGGGDPYHLIWTDLLNNPAVWTSFGKMFYVDQFLGNEDRFESLKIQNVFIDSADRVMALDNDAMAPAYLSENTVIDATAGIPQPGVVHQMTELQYVTKVIDGGQVAGSSRRMASLGEISGGANELQAKVHAKVDALLQMLLVGTAGAPGDANKVAANAVLQILIANPAPVRAAMLQGAEHARVTIMGMFDRGLVGKSPMQKLRDAQKTSAGKSHKVADKVLYSWLALAIRHAYLLARYQGQGHQAALASVHAQFSREIRRSGAVATTTQYLDPQGQFQEDLVIQ